MGGCQTGSCAVGHFTAIVWKGVSEIGCAQNSRRIYICRYRSGDSLSKNTANMRGHYEEMVLPAVKSCETCEAEVGNSGGSPSQIPVPTPARPVPTPAPAPSVPAPSGCSDIDGACDYYRKHGYCSSSDHVRRHCMKTCGVCNSAPCVDKDGHCAHYASLGYCSMDHIRQHCAKTCGAC